MPVIAYGCFKLVCKYRDISLNMQTYFCSDFTYYLFPAVAGPAAGFFAARGSAGSRCHSSSRAAGGTV